MDPSHRELLDRLTTALNDGDPQAAGPLLHADVVFDWSRSIAPYRDVYRGKRVSLELISSFLDIWDKWRWRQETVEELPDGRLVLSTRVSGRGKGSGVEINARGAQLVAFKDGLVAALTLFQSTADAHAFVALESQLERLRAARLYFVCDGRPGDGDPAALLDAALRGGVDLIQLREKAPRCAEELVSLAEPFRRAADEHDALFFLNDHPELVDACRADGVHVGQDDTPVAEARAQAGPGALVGLSTHSPAQFDAALAAEGDARPDQISAGPVWETPTKAGRPAAGLELIRHAAEAAAGVPWFAIGGIDLSNVGEVVEAGAGRAVVVRAIRDAADPENAARALRAALDARVAA